MSDPRKANTLEDACSNGDGTYNGLKLLSWLSEAFSPGKGVSQEEVRKIFEEVKARKAKP